MGNKYNNLTFLVRQRHFLLRCHEVLEMHACDPRFTSLRLSNNMALSRMQLYRKLKKISGQPPSALIRNFRLRKSCDILSLGELSVSQVAYSVGFSSPSYFIQCFKKRYNCTPKEYQLMVKKNPMLHSLYSLLHY